MNPHLVVALLVALTAGAAHAAERIYWSNYNGFKVSFAELDGSAAGDVPTGTATVYGPYGLGLDPAHGRIYWTNAGAGPNKISFANLDGSGGADLAITGATVSTPLAFAIDPVAGRIYWSNFNGKISFANLDGSGGADLVTTGATVAVVKGLALDPGAGRLYLANVGSGTNISYAAVNGSGGADLAITGATLSQPAGLALDLGAGRIYWANAAGNKISVADLNGANAADLAIVGTTVSAPVGVALDLAAGRIYWTNQFSDHLSYANLDGSGAGDLATLTATLNNPYYVALLDRPAGAGAPTVTGTATVGATLSCSHGSWAPDQPPAFFFRSPTTFAVQWTLAGADIAGATQDSFTPSSAGDYGCRVTATNAAGSASQISAAYPVAQPAFGTDTLVTLEVAAAKIPARGPLAVQVANTNSFAVTGTLSGESVRRIPAAHTRQIKVKPIALSLAAQTGTAVDVKLSPALRRLLRHKHARWALRLTATVEDQAGNTRTVTLDTPAS